MPKQAKTLQAQELRRVLDYIATRPHALRNRTMLLATHLAGLRVGEVANLRYRDVVDAAGVVRDEIRLEPEQTKGRHARTVFVNAKLKRELEAYLRAILKANQRIACSTHRRSKVMALLQTH